jgi:histidine triad (HIT) family protein
MPEVKSIFKKIIDREIPAKIVYEDELCIAFHDVAPQAPVHVLLIPKKEIENVAALSTEDQQLAGHLLLIIGHIARELGVNKSGYRVIANCGQHGGQSVNHLHFHIMAGRQLKWPPG